MAFFDNDNDDKSQPKGFLLHSAVQIIVATSPRGAYRKWITQTMSSTTIFTKLAISRWSVSELFITGLVLTFLLSTPRLTHFFRVFLHASDVTLKLLRESTLYFGRNPRRCFDASCSRARLEVGKREVVHVITNLARKPTEILRVLCDRQANAEEISHRVFELIQTNKSRQFEKFPMCTCLAVGSRTLGEGLQKERS